jgi:hypothetical protein
MSGYAEEAFRRNDEKAEDLHFLPKPFGLKQLAAKVKEVLSGAPAPVLRVNQFFKPIGAPSHRDRVIAATFRAESGGITTAWVSQSESVRFRPSCAAFGWRS